MSIPALPADSSSLTPIFPNEQCPLDWGDRGGPCWRCWPTDGESCGQWIEECICSICCQLCTETKAYSYSLGQPCAIINHCCPVCCCPLLVGALTRYNTRLRLKIGAPGCPGFCCDLCLVMLCPICSCCQVSRANHDVNAWAWYRELGLLLCSVEPCVYLWTDSPAARTTGTATGTSEPPEAR